MLFFTRISVTITTITQYLSFSRLTDFELPQQPIGGHSHPSLEVSDVWSKAPPFFEPPGSNIDNFKCDYSNMGPDWVNCTEIEGCWLINKKTGANFTVNTTDYEQVAPIGITRHYTLNVTDGHHMNRDGILFKEGKLFNKSFPGPLLEACWGDTLNITVINHSKFNGTSIHWHGIRQNQTMHMDGVNGITQCPIAPKDSFNYIWKAVQYGSSWYHSHYSVQYADGLQAPITIHGPTTLAFDEAKAPLITSDWLHNSAFEAIYDQDTNWPTLLLDGKGNCSRMYNEHNQRLAHCDKHSIKRGFEMTFDPVQSKVAPGKRRYLLRVINTSFTTSIRFSIDNHYLSVIEADFVPVKNTTRLESVLVAIGQRYHVIVEAKPEGEHIPVEKNFWIRTNGAGCFDDVKGDDHTGYERTGILRYVGAPDEDPKSKPWPGNWGKCTVEAPKNGPSLGKQGHIGEILEVKGFNLLPNTTYALGHFALNRPHTKFTPFQTTYGNPTFLNLDNFDDLDPSQADWPAGWVVIPENFTSTDFVYLVLKGQGHPIHLHGHDFAIVEYNQTHDFKPEYLHPPYVNPMRRDVVLLPDTTKGFVVIAFKTDNPGAWLMHCHIALHASWGLSLQIMERQSAANEIWKPGASPALTRARRTCAKWNSWAYDCRNQWPGNVSNTYPACVNATALQGDSGI